MADINRDSDEIELASPPRFAYGERVIARSMVRNDGTYNGFDVGEVLVHKGEIGYVININTFLQQFYIYAVDFVESGHRVGMRAKELCFRQGVADTQRVGRLVHAHIMLLAVKHLKKFPTGGRTRPPSLLAKLNQ